MILAFHMEISIEIWKYLASKLKCKNIGLGKN
jgi:hypothetical protein